METTKMDDLQEIRAEIAERFHEWSEQLKREALTQGEAHLLLHLLRKRFGDLPESVTSRVNSAPAALLEIWGERVLDATSLAALFSDNF
jgi:hypothetical protein